MSRDSDDSQNDLIFATGDWSKEFQKQDTDFSKIWVDR